MHTLIARAARLALALVVVLVALGAVPTAAQSDSAPATGAGRRLFLPIARNPAPAPPPPQTIADLTIRPVPLREVQRGNSLSVEYRFRNDDTRTATASFSLFYPSRLLNFTRVDSNGDRYVFHDATRVVVEVRNVAAGETRTGRINFVVPSTAGIGSQIGLFAEFTCRAGQTCRSNFAEVEVIRNSDETNNGGVFTMSASPDRGPPGTAFTFSGSRFRPGEPFVTWLNTPSGVQPLSITGRADSQGRIRFTFGSGQLTQAGFYSMVAHGQESNVQNVGPFIVQINGQPAALDAAPALAGGAALALDAAPAATPAQATGEGGVAGRIVDSAGAGVAGVSVEVRDAAGALAAVAVSRADGVYFVPTGLASGQYTVAAVPSANPDLALLGPAASGPVAVTAPEITRGVTVTLPPAGGLAGLVRGRDGALAGVRVNAVGVGGALLGADVTGGDGRYSIANLPAGSYTLEFDPQGAAQAGLYAAGRLAGQAVTAGQIAAVPDVGLAPSSSTGVIAGKVGDAATGAGIGDVLVVITAESGAFVSIAHTAGDGTYTSDPLQPGRYRVQFVTLFSELPATARYVGEFFDDAPSFAASALLPVVAGEQVVANAGLVAGGSIAGTVTGAGGGPLAGVLVVAFDEAGVPRALATTAANGAYTLSGLRAGSYTLRAFTSQSRDGTTPEFADGGYDTTPATPELTPVAVAAGAAVTGIDIALARGAVINGTVSTGDTGEGLAGVLVVFIRTSGGSPALAGLALSDSGGRYSSPALAPGAYAIWFTTIFSSDAKARTYQDEFFSNRASLETADPVVIAAGATTLTRNVELAQGSSVLGRVTGADSGAGLAGVFVVARVGTTVVGGAVTDDEGRYTLAGLPAGEVGVTFDPGQAIDPRVRAYAPAAVTLSVPAGAETTRDVELQVRSEQ
jgi:hypothetical protein